MQCRIFRDPVMNRRVDSDPNHIYKDMNEFSSMIPDIKKDERSIDPQSGDPQSGEYSYYIIKKLSTAIRS